MQGRRCVRRPPGPAPRISAEYSGTFLGRSPSQKRCQPTALVYSIIGKQTTAASNFCAAARQQASSRYFSSSARVPERQSALLLRLFSTMRSALLALAITTTSGLAPPKDYHVSRPRENAFFLGAAAFCQNPNATGCLSTRVEESMWSGPRGRGQARPVSGGAGHRVRGRGLRGARHAQGPVLGEHVGGQGLGRPAGREGR